MALFDKVKSSAQDVAKRAQEAGKIGQAKLDDFQAKRQLDALYRDLGEAVYAQRTGASGSSSATVDAAVQAITDHIAVNAEPADTPAYGAGASGGGMPTASYSSSDDEESAT
jgi:hypothetical protein